MGIELLRCVSMFMIVFIHILNNGGILKDIECFSINYHVMNYLNTVGAVSVNLYALITGYVCFYSRNKYERLINLWFKVFFYSVVITLIFVVLPNYKVGIGECFFSFLPVFTNRYWYFTSYFCLFFVVPLINKGLQNLSIKLIKTVVVLGFVLLSIFESFGNLFVYNFSLFCVNDGYSPIWLMYLYIVGVYIRIRKENCIEKVKPSYIILYLLFTLLAYGAFVAKDFVISEFNISLLNNIDFTAYNSPFIFISSILLFLIFINVNIKKGSKIINIFSSVSFSVYLISTHPYIFTHIQSGLFEKFANYNVVALLVIVFTSAIIIYFGCSVVCILVDKLLNKIHFSRIISKLYNDIFLEKRE